MQGGILTLKMARASNETSEAKFPTKVEKKRRFTLYHLQIQLRNVLTNAIILLH